MKIDKTQALYKFWSSFGLPAYNELTVPDNAELPYITYEVATGSLGDIIPLSASIWYNSYSWEEVAKKSDEVAEFIYKQDPPGIKIKGGRLYITKGKPFTRDMDDDSSKMIRKRVININAEFQTAD